MLGYLKTNAASYAADGPEAAAKLAIVAAATGSDATAFGGVDLIAKVNAGIAPDGAFGSWVGPFAQGLGMVALARNGEPIPASMVTWLTDSLYRNSDGGYGFSTGADSDGDSTGMALLALLAVPSPTCEVSTAIVAAEAWSASNQASAGYWAGYSPVNTTGILGSALQAAGLDQPEAVTWLAGQQVSDGGLPAELNGTTSDLMATVQGIFLLAGTSYLDVPTKSPAVTATAVPTSCTSTTATATATASTTATATTSATATASTTASGQPVASATARTP